LGDASAARAPFAPLVSVIMNGFNSARYLREAIDSLRAQTYANWEMEFYDNCSEDDSEAIVRSYGDPRIRFRRAPHRLTLAQGRNAAIEGARGEWIAFLDCDDLWAPRKLELQMERIASDAQGEVGMVYARTVSFSARGDEGETTYRYEGVALPEGALLRPLLLEGNLVPLVSALVSREAFDRCGPIPGRFTFAEDYWLFVSIAAAYRVLCVQEACCHYRVHEGSATYRNKLASHREALQVLEEWGQHLQPAELARRRRTYHTLIGLEMLRLPGQAWAGVRRIVVEGSLVFLIRGGIAHALRRYARGRRSYS
jgi:glycosyltransferase involved in cell wall biosynthesis